MVENFFICWKINQPSVNSHFKSVKSCCAASAGGFSRCYFQFFCWKRNWSANFNARFLREFPYRIANIIEHINISAVEFNSDFWHTKFIEDWFKKLLLLLFSKENNLFIL